VNVAGRTVSACTTPAVDGQQIASAAMGKYRQRLVTLLLEQGRHTCVSCERTGDCRLQETAAALDAPAVETCQHDFPARDNSHPEVTLDRSRCILCGICVVASLKLDGKNLFAFAGNGANACLIVDSVSGLLVDSAIAAHDHAVRLCPVGALIRKQDRAETGFGFGGMDLFDTSDWS
jgi:[NiFe] hydrogenase diaphorase moiety small subunit